MSEHTTEWTLDKALEMLLSAPVSVRRSPRYHQAVEMIWEYLNGAGLRYLKRTFNNLSVGDLEEIPLRALESIYSTQSVFEVRGENSAKAWLRNNLRNRAIDCYRKLMGEREKFVPQTLLYDGGEIDRGDSAEADRHEEAVIDQEAQERASEYLTTAQEAFSVATDAYLASISTARQDRQERDRRLVEVHRALFMGETTLSGWYEEEAAGEASPNDEMRARNRLHAQVSRFRKALKDFVVDEASDLPQDVAQSVSEILDRMRRR